MIKINDKFNGLTLLKLLEYFHLGNETKKKMSFSINAKEASFSDVLNTNDVLTYTFPDTKVAPWNESVTTLYEDEYIVAVDKKAFLAVHPDSDANTKTLLNALANKYEYIKPLHRLDMETTGIVLCSKDPLVTSYFGQAFADHEVKKHYTAVTSGVYKQKSGVIETFIGRNRHISGKMRVSEDGNKAITEYKTIQKLRNNLTVTSLVIVTGRKHQIRVHMSYNNTPVIGDKLYNGRALFPRVCLHASKLEFVHPVSQKRVVIESNLPLDMRSFISKNKE